MVKQRSSQRRRLCTANTPLLSAGQPFQGSRATSGGIFLIACNTMWVSGGPGRGRVELNNAKETSGSVRTLSGR